MFFELVYMGLNVYISPPPPAPAPYNTGDLDKTIGAMKKHIGINLF